MVRHTIAPSIREANKCHCIIELHGDIMDLVRILSQCPHGTKLDPSMKAQVLLKSADIKNRPLQLQDVEIPQPGPGEVLIKTIACGICRTDLHVVEGELNLKQLPIIPGHQVVGKVVKCGSEVNSTIGTRVGVAWLHSTCGKCRFCLSHRENLCESALFTGWTAQGGFAEYIIAPEQFIYPLPASFPSIQAAPLLCAGIIGYRSLKRMDIPNWSGSRIGIYGFGAAGHITIQLLKAWGAEVYVCTREKNHQELAHELGAVWVGGTLDTPPLPYWMLQRSLHPLGILCQ